MKFIILAQPNLLTATLVAGDFKGELGPNQILVDLEESKALELIKYQTSFIEFQMLLEKYAKETVEASKKGVKIEEGGLNDSI